MKEHILEGEIIRSTSGKVEAIRTYPRQRTVTLTESELRNLQADRWGWGMLRICGAALLILVPIYLIGVSLKPQPSILPKCESNCQLDQGLF